MKVVSYPNQREALKVENVTFRSLYDDRLTENDLKKARLELGETEEKRKESLLQLRNALIRDKDFHYRLDEEYLLRYLRYRKYDNKKTYTTIRKFYEYRKERPDLFNLSPNLEFFLTRDLMKCLPYRDEEGCIIFWIDSGNWKLEEMSFGDVLSTMHALSDVITIHASMQINGIVGLWDLGGLTANHIYQNVYLSTVKTFLKSMQSSYPWRIKRVVGINCNWIVRKFYNIFRYLLNKKIADRIVLLGTDFSELHQYFNPRIIPKKYGGYIDSSDCKLAQLVLDNLEYIKYERSFGPNVEF